jgi:hypothetical protein
MLILTNEEKLALVLSIVNGTHPLQHLITEEMRSIFEKELDKAVSRVIQHILRPLN